MLEGGGFASCEVQRSGTKQAAKPMTFKHMLSKFN